MTVLVALSVLAFALTSAIVGARLLGLARRDGHRPELLLGLSLFSIGGVSFPLAVLLGTGLVTGAAEMWLQAIALTPAGIAGACVMAFTSAVFRPRVRWALALAALGALAWTVFLATGWWQLVATGEALPPAGPRVVVRSALFLLGYSWASIEAIAFARQLKRRLALGLADPVVHDRIRLFGLGMGCAALLCSVLLGVAVRGSDPTGSPLLQLMISIGGTGTAVCFLLGFLPPRRYLAAVQARGDSATS